eukprot:69536_1
MDTKLFIPPKNTAQIDYMMTFWKSINQFSETMMKATNKYKTAISRKSVTISQPETKKQKPLSKTNAIDITVEDFLLSSDTDSDKDIKKAKQKPSSILWEEFFCPVADTYDNILLEGLNDSELILLSHDSYGSAIYIFNEKYNKWNKYKHSPDFISDISRYYQFSRYYTAALDKKNKILYINDTSGGKLFKINFESNTFDTFPSNIIYGMCGTSFVVDEKFHFLGRDHLIWDDIKHSFIKQNVPKSFNALCCGIFHIPYTNKILKLGGFESIRSKKQNIIYSYNIKNKLWNKVTLELPKPLKGHSIVPIPSNYIKWNKKAFCIILSGIYPSGYPINRDIFILDTVNMIFKKSKIKVPGFGQRYVGMIPSNKAKENIICHGYIRYIWKNDKLYKLLFPPLYLIERIACYYSNNYLYLIDVNYSSNYLSQRDMKQRKHLKFLA